MGDKPPKNKELMGGLLKKDKPSAKRRSIICCSLIGFGSSASILSAAFLLASTPLAAIGLALALVSAADVWQLLRG